MICFEIIYLIRAILRMIITVDGSGEQNWTDKIYWQNDGDFSHLNNCLVTIMPKNKMRHEIWFARCKRTFRYTSKILVKVVPKNFVSISRIFNIYCTNLNVWNTMQNLSWTEEWYSTSPISWKIPQSKHVVGSLSKMKHMKVLNSSLTSQIQ